ncbi:flippase [Thomasclavelia spiroformis]|uniref:flippase n=1 Tax=Thomasclavelia spiroformis TaxID=29348 RepID=UPI00265F43AB|nr:flippase [Thomasclavelia spiroformis]
MKSMKKNAVLTIFRTLLSLLIPLITFPYITRILSVEEIGGFNFSTSIISYLVLIAGLGINTYAIREGAKIRENKARIDQFASEMYTINIFSTLFAYVVLIFLLITINKFNYYKSIILILSLTVFLNCFSRQWIFNVYEDFEVITYLQMAFQILSVILTLVCIRHSGDVNKYALIYVLSTSGPYLIYGFISKKYVKINFKNVSLSDLKKHIKPIMIIFGMAIATTVYINSDITILGFLANDYTVGIYSTAVKIYNIVKQVLVAVITVTIPRLTAYAGTEKFKSLFTKVFDALIVMTIPAMVGLYMLSKNVVLIIAGNHYLQAVSSLRILCFAIVCALIANLFGTCVLLPYGKELIFLIATVISALVNIILNFILIPFFGENAAAFTTALSQFIVLVIHYYYSKKYIDISKSIKCIILCIIGSGLIITACLVVKSFHLALYIETIVVIFISVLLYGISQIILGNDIVIDLIKSTLSKIKNK